MQGFRRREQEPLGSCTGEAVRGAFSPGFEMPGRWIDEMISSRGGIRERFRTLGQVGSNGILVDVVTEGVEGYGVTDLSFVEGRRPHGKPALQTVGKIAFNKLDSFLKRYVRRRR